MLERWRVKDRRLEAALAASIFLHAVVGLFFPGLQANYEDAPESRETITLQKIAHVSLQRAHGPSAARSAVVVARATPVPRAVRPHEARPRVKSPASRPSRHAIALRTPGALENTRDFAVGPKKGPAGPVVAGSPVATGAPQQTATPASALRDQPQQVAASEGNAQSGGRAPFLEQQVPVLESSAREQLRRHFRMNVVLVILVSDDGKTEGIEFHPPVSDDIKKQISDLLGAAHWDAAVCGGGITCEGKATINLSQ